MSNKSDLGRGHYKGQNILKLQNNFGSLLPRDAATDRKLCKSSANN